MNNRNTEKKGVSASEDAEAREARAREQSEKNLERAVKKGMKSSYIKVITRLLLAVLIISAVTAFGTALVKYNKLQREKEVLEDKAEEYEAEAEKLEYLIDCPIDYDYIVRIAKEKLNLFLPDEIIYHNDTNK